MSIEVIKPAMWCPGFRADHPLAVGCVGYYPIWAGSGDRIMDVAGRHHGTALGGPTWAKGSRGRALDLTAAVDQGIATPLQLGTPGEFSIHLLTKTSQHIDQRYWVDTSDGTSGFGWRQETSGANGMEFFAYRSGGVSLVNHAFTPVEGAWHHLTAVMTPSDVRVYVNGVFGNSNSDAIGPLVQGANLAIGFDYTFGANSINGQIGGAAIWSRALSPSEAIWLHEEPNVLTTPPSTMTVFSVAASAAGAPAGNPWYYYAQQEAAA